MLVNGPKRIICLTEESVEFLYGIGEQDRIIGVSAFVQRPIEAKAKKKIGAFTSANIDKICELKPDLVVGYSDIQKDIAKELIGRGVEVWIANHRSLEEILEYCRRLGYFINCPAKTDFYLEKLEKKIKSIKEVANTIQKRPKVYIEEWDEPMISGIRYFSDCVELCAGVNVLGYKAKSLAKDRMTSLDEVKNQNPDIILASWCGKKVDLDLIKSRKGWEDIDAIKNNQVFELSPEIFLQPGPALITDGCDILLEIFQRWSSSF